ncbi:PAAR domain-containing protein [Burkholderia sp. Bp9012]|uniref:PAAR domain-containing protein n=1 Tax=Burkholderia sp. Bp9012 TaxID=2184562 RepID=UPI000F5AE79A|nr:PAAR domain-containing protein [Burkholderia sp. Bp9012]RQR87053.1 PAAR domain-containing protein [Burkholderia sp. Bp9012]
MSERAWIRKGDTSSAGGEVLEGIENAAHHGVALTFVGAQVFCPVCKSIGHIEAAGHRLPMTMYGKEQALEDDLCRCLCNPPPTMIASQHIGVQNFGQGSDAAAVTPMVVTPGPRLVGITLPKEYPGTSPWATQTPALENPSDSPIKPLGDADPFEYAEDVTGDAEQLAGVDRSDMMACDIIRAECKGSVLREFPGQYLNSTLGEIQSDAGDGVKEARKALKLLNDNRFKK